MAMLLTMGVMAIVPNNAGIPRFRREMRRFGNEQQDGLKDIEGRFGIGFCRK